MRLENQTVIFCSFVHTHLIYDADGYLTSDGRWTYTWNGENRLVRAAEAIHPTNRAARVVEYAYDHRGRMVWKTIGGTNAPPDTALAYLWDDYNIVRERKNAEDTYNIWGLDLDGSMQGCGGVGGLLAVVKGGEVYTPTYDANGNISEYLDSDGTIAAHQEYDPFGNAVVSSGAAAFTHWFSTKPWCGVTGVYEYQFRKYRPEVGRWMSRDPMNSQFVQSEVSFASNVPLSICDRFGLDNWSSGGQNEVYRVSFSLPNGQLVFKAPLEGKPLPPRYQHDDLLGKRGENDFDKESCTLMVPIRYMYAIQGVRQPDSYNEHFTTSLKNTIETYFNSQNYKCYASESCSVCPEGVAVKVSFTPVTDSGNYDCLIIIGDRISRAWTDAERGIIRIGPNGATKWPTNHGGMQIPILHEFGHFLGLPHPSGKWTNAYEDYSADLESLMGCGMKLRMEDYSKAFCSRLNSATDCCEGWHAQNTAGNDNQ